MGAVQRITDRLSQLIARHDGIVIPGEVESPMDRNPTMEISRQVIASCARQADDRSRAAARRVLETAITARTSAPASHRAAAV